MKILHIPNYYFPHIGGIEQTARDCVNALSQYEQKIFCFNHENKNITEKVDNTEVVRAGCFAKFASQSLSFSYGKLLRNTINDFKPDIIIFHFPNPFAAHFLLKILKKYENCKLIIWWHLDITKQKILRILFEGQTRRLLKRANKIIATSPNYLEKSKFLPDYKDKCIVISSCINDERLVVTEDVVLQSQDIKRQNEGKCICFAFGRHVKYKGFEYLIKSAKLLDDNFVIFLGGTGKLTKRLKKMAKGDEKIIFTGKLSDNDLKSYLLACDIFCFPSITKNEAFGLALAEAMHFGKPVITFTIDGSGVNYVNLKDVTGLEVENQNIEQYADAIKKLVAHPELCTQYGIAAKLRVDTLFTQIVFKKNVLEAIASIYKYSY